MDLARTETALQAWLAALGPAAALGWALAENLAQVGACLGGGWLLQRLLPQRRVSPPPPPLTATEGWVAAATLLGNTAVTWLGWLAWRQGWIALRPSGSVLAALADAVGLLLAMDLAMYLGHRVAHLPPLFAWVHALHHRYRLVRPLTLFVLSPLEVAGFGAVWLAVLALWQPSWSGMIAYLLLNAWWGAVGHSGVEPLPRRLPVLTGGRFHADHHLDPSGNFGFYTDLWDRLFGTRGTAKPAAAASRG